MDPYSRGSHQNSGYDQQQQQQQYPPQYGSNNQQQYQARPPPNYNQGGYPPQQQPRGPPTNYQGGPPPNAQNRNPNSNWPRGPPPPNHMQGGGPPPQGRGPPPHQAQQQRGPPSQQQQPDQYNNYQHQNSFGTGASGANQNYPPQNQNQAAPQQQQYQQQQPADQQYQQEEPYPEQPIGTIPKGPFDPEISDIELNEKYNRVTNHSSNIQNLLMIIEKQLQTTKALSQANTSFKETTKSIFSPQHHYFNESCRIVDVHGVVAQMYQRYIPELEQTVSQVRNWSNKYNILSDMKKNRDKASSAFDKKHITYEKKRAANTSQAPAKLLELQKLEHEAKLSMTFLNTQNQQLINLYDELMKDKHEVLNKIVADYMFKSYHFHKKSNQQFQMLSSIDTEGHKTAELLNKGDVKDRHLHRFTVLNQEDSSKQQQPQYDAQQNPNYTQDFSSQQPQNYDGYQDQQQYGQDQAAANYDYGTGVPTDQNQYDYNQQQPDAAPYVDPNLQFYSQGGDEANNYSGDAAGTNTQPPIEQSYIQHAGEFSTNTNPLDLNNTTWQSHAPNPSQQQPPQGFDNNNYGGGPPVQQRSEESTFAAQSNPPPPRQVQPSNAVLDLDDIFGVSTIPSAPPQQQPPSQQFQPQAPAQQPRGPLTHQSSNPLDDIFANPGPSSQVRASVDTQSFNFGAPSAPLQQQPAQQFRPQPMQPQHQQQPQRPPPQMQQQNQFNQHQQMAPQFPPAQQQPAAAPSTGDPFADLFGQNLSLNTNQPQMNPQHRPQGNSGFPASQQQQPYNQHQTSQVLPGANPFADM